MVQPVEALVPYADQVYKGLLNAISHCEMPPGQRIPQAEIAASFGVSRQPVSHALHLLKQQGLIEAWGKKGFAVSEVQVDHIRDLYQIRGQLDALAAKLAAQRVKAKKVPAERLEAAKAALGAAQKLETIREILAYELSFHKEIYALSGNQSIERTMAAHWPHLLRAMALIHSRRKTTQQAHDEHTAILDAIAQGDAKRAHALALDHAERAGVEMAQHLASSQAEQMA